ncbi:MAG: YihY/virulence factor BrkB family protein [Bacilli bacterium]|nr:YihY/virulence factor BrkB family protein [Bacilli bacterium]
MKRIKPKLNNYITKAWKVFNKMEMRVLPGNVAFFFVLALIPIITITLIIASSFSISFNSVIEFVQDVFPEEASRMILEIISGKGFDGNVGTFNIIAFFVASNGTYAIINASNTLYNIKDSDPLRERVKSVVLLMILILLITFLIIVPVLGETLLNLIKNNLVIERIKTIYYIIKWPVTFFMIFTILKFIYTIAPSKKIASKTTTYGALFTTFFWTIATAIFSYYLKFFANYNVIYGNISSIIILMIWVYIISYVFVMGIAINAVNLKDEK